MPGTRNRQFSGTFTRFCDSSEYKKKKKEKAYARLKKIHFRRYYIIRARLVCDVKPTIKMARTFVLSTPAPHVCFPGLDWKVAIRVGCHSRLIGAFVFARDIKHPRIRAVERLPRTKGVEKSSRKTLNRKKRKQIWLSELRSRPKGWKSVVSVRGAVLDPSEVATKMRRTTKFHSGADDFRECNATPSNEKIFIYKY